VPKIQNNSIWLWKCVPLNSNRGLLAYSQSEYYPDRVPKPIFTAIAIISIDFNAGVYKFIGEPLKFPVSDSTSSYLFLFSSTSAALLQTKNSDLTSIFRLVKIDASFSFISLQKSIVVSGDFNGIYHFIDGKIVCAMLDRIVYVYTRIVKGFAWINDDGLLVEIENTGACLKSNLVTDKPDFVCLNY
jgi:hypothetical protein